MPPAKNRALAAAQKYSSLAPESRPWRLAVKLYGSIMSTAARQLLQAFAALAEADRREVLLELLRNTPETPYEAPSDQELIRAADDIFQEIDRRETST